MFVTIAFRSYAQVIREAEQLEPSMSDDEIAVRLDHYSQKIWKHLAEFGIKFQGLAEHTSAVAAFQVSIAGVGTDWQTGAFDFQKLNEGLNWLRPTAITVELSDLPYLVPNKPMCSAAQAAWPEIEHEFQRILPSQLFEKIERIVPSVAFRSSPAPTTESERKLQDIGFDEWCLQNGLTDPLAKHNAVENFRQAEEAAYSKAHPEQFRNWGVIP